MRKAVYSLLFLLSLSSPPFSRADLYLRVAEDGVESYTDTPTSPDAVLIRREDGPSPSPRTRRPAGADRLPVRGVLTSGTGLRRDPIDGLLRLHKGVDIAVPPWTEVHSVGRGRVLFAGSRSGYGNLVILSHPDGSTSLYAHNSIVFAREGDEVESGEVVALTGSTGRSTGPHLHFELWKDGVNLTEAFVLGSGPPPLDRLSSTGPDGGDVIRRIIQADGTPWFTNVPPLSR